MINSCYLFTYTDCFSPEKTGIDVFWNILLLAKL